MDEDDEQSSIVTAVVLAQSRALAAQYVVESLLVELAQLQPDARKFLSQILERALERFDRIEPTQRSRVVNDARAAIEGIVSRAGRDASRRRLDPKP